MIFSASKASMYCMERETITTGMLNAVNCIFCFSKDWSGLSKVAVFQCGECTIDVLVENDQALIPHEVLVTENIGEMLHIGVYGVNQDGRLIIPTIMCNAGEVQLGADPSGDPSIEPTPTVYDQILADNAVTRQKAQEAVEAKDVAVDAKDRAILAETNANTDAHKAEGYAVGTADGEPVGNTSPYYHNNAGYYAEQAGNSASSAGSSAADAQRAKEAIEALTVLARTLAAGSSATVTKTVDPVTGVVTLNFGIPRGDTGATPQLSIGDVTTGEPGSAATVTISGTAENPVLSFSIPKGAKGDTGNGIIRIEKTGSAGVLDIYTVYYTDGTTWSYQVANSSEASADRITYSFDDPHPSGYAGNAINDLQIAFDLLITWITHKEADWDPRIASLEESAIKTVKKNGTALPVSGNGVDITVPTKTSDLTNDDHVVKDASYVHTDNNFTDTLKTKLNGVESGAQKNVNPDWNAISGDAEILNKPANLVSDANYVHTDNNFTTQQVNNIAKLLTRTTIVSGTVTLTNSETFPFNNSQVTVPISVERDNQNYIVDYEVTAAVGNVGDIIVSAKLVNGFKIEFTGSASSVTIKYQVLGGMA